MADLGTQQLSDMRSEVLELLGKPSQAYLVTKIDHALNRRLEWVVKQGDFPTLVRQDEVGLRTPSDTDSTIFQGSAAYAPLPWGCRNVQAMFLQVSAENEVEQLSAEEMARRYSITTTGRPKHYAIVGETVQHTELAASDTFVVSGDAVNDDGVATARVWYRTNSGHLGEVVSPSFSGAFSTGITSPSAAAPGWPIERISVSSNWAGDITITRTTGGTELAKIATPFATASSNPMSRVETRPLIRVAPTPDAAYKATVIWKRIPRRLVKADDAPEIPVSTALVYGAAADLLRAEKRYAQAREMEAMAHASLSTEVAGESMQGGFAAPAFGNFIDQCGVEYQGW